MSTHTMTRPILFGAAALLAALAACRSAGEHQLAADDEVYGILEERRAELVATPDAFSIDPPPDSLRARILAGEVEEVGPLDVLTCLEVAAESNRDYQRQREQLYLEALDLTFERYRFGTQPSAMLGAFVSGEGRTANTAQADADLGLSRLLGTGAQIVGDIGLSLFRSLSSGDGWDAVSQVSLSIAQPLLGGSGAKIVLESLTQAERNVLYEVRSYERYRRTLAVDVAGRLYRLLQQADAVANQQANFASLTALRERNEELARAGRLSDIQADQARQDELSSRNRLIVEQQRFEGQMDDFKLFLGLPIETRLMLDPQVLDELGELEDLAIPEEKAITIGLRERLDFRTVLEQVEDSERLVEVRADALRATLDLVAQGEMTSAEGQPLSFPGSQADWSLSLDLDLPIDRLSERNSYRSAQISLQAARRGAKEQEDIIRADLRDALRQTRADGESWRIRVNAVTLAERRVESANLNLEAGRATTRDVLEAQESLLDNQNAETQALIDFHLSRLNLYLDLEILRVDPSGIDVDPELFAELAEED